MNKGVWLPLAAALSSGLAGAASAAPVADPGLLFYLSADRGFTADFARGDPAPNFLAKVKIVPTGVSGGAIEAEGDQVLSWLAPGNIYSQRGTLSFFWRAREPVGRQPFPVFRVGYADHTSWDMAWLRIDWNGHGFDAFVTDDNLARTRVSFALPGGTLPPDKWTHLAFAWDEAQGIRLYVDGRLAARQDARIVSDAALDQFGPHSRIIGPHQVQSAYQFRRGGDVDEIRIYDHALDDAAVAALARNQTAAVADAAAPLRTLADPATRAEWLTRYGWNRGGDAPPLLADRATRIRKVEFTDAYDLKQRMNAGNDGIPETTWPGVYNRSRLPGRHDYFELPDWNVYVEGGRAVTFQLPDEPWNHIEVQGAADGAFSYLAGQAPRTGSPARPAGAVPLGTRPAGQERTFTQLARTLRGGALRFDNALPETPLQEVAAYHLAPGVEPDGAFKLTYTVRAKADPKAYPAAEAVTRFIDGRFVADERQTVAALSEGADLVERSTPASGGLPIVHVVIPYDFRDPGPGHAVGHYGYGWRNLDAGLDGVALELPALKGSGAIPLNIQIKDPLWPERNLLDVSVSVPAGQPRTLWLDTRDRLLPDDASLYLAIASASPAFDASALDGAQIRLVFKDRAAAIPEHVADRWVQARDNMAFLVEEHSNSQRLARFRRLEADLHDVLRADPGHMDARLLWAEINGRGWPAFTQPAPPAGVPLWAFRQTEDLKLVHRFVNWWIDNRQADYGDFGGGLSDDTDLNQQWPPLVLMGVDPDNIGRSLMRMSDATFRNGMWTGGLSTIKTDELHSYEEGINGISETMYAHYGDPKVVERLMATARAYPRLVQVNPAGHTHIVSNLFSGSEVVREGIWQWSKPYSNLILQPGILLADFNGHAGLKKLVTDLADSFLAHVKTNPDGSVSVPAEIYWPTDEARNNAASYQGGYELTQLFWAAYRFTGDPRYLTPLPAWVRNGDYAGLGVINANLLDVLGKRAAWAPSILEKAKTERGQGAEDRASYFNRYNAWQLTGDKRWLESLYGDEIRIDSQRMSMVTDQHWWSDRVELFSDLLQRTRLGGMAVRRNQIVPGHVVSWRFAEPGAAERVAVLVPGATPTRFKVIAYNLGDTPIHARMTGWDVAPGQWRVTQGFDANDDDKADGPTTARSFAFERTASTELVFAPRRTSVFEFERVAPGDDPASRPDVGIGREDVRVAGNAVAVTVHSLGSADAPSSTVTLEDGGGRVLARAAVAPLAAPRDLLPKTATVRLTAPGGVRPGYRVRVSLDGGAREITQLNNEVLTP